LIAFVSPSVEWLRKTATEAMEPRLTKQSASNKRLTILSPILYCRLSAKMRAVRPPEVAETATKLLQKRSLGGCTIYRSHYQHVRGIIPSNCHRRGISFHRHPGDTLFARCV